MQPEATESQKNFMQACQDIAINKGDIGKNPINLTKNLNGREFNENYRRGVSERWMNNSKWQEAI